MHLCQNQPDDSLLPGGGSLRSEMETYPNTHTQNPCQSLLSVCRGLIGHSKGPDGGGAKRREHGWPPLYQSDNSSSTQTKLTCRCTGHVQAVCGNKSHWIRGRYLSAPLNAPSLPLLSLDEKMCLPAWLSTSHTADWTVDWTAHAGNYGKSLFFMYDGLFAGSIIISTFILIWNKGLFTFYCTMSL